MNRILLLTVAVAIALQIASAIPFHKEESDKLSLFKEFVNKHNKVYSTNEEFQARFETFQRNLNIIDGLNKKGSSATFGVNKFADLSPEEFRRLYLNTKIEKDPSFPVAPALPKEYIQALPDTIDWREKGAVTGVKDQGQCGSCWAFSTVGNVEGQWALAGNKLVGLSEQNLVDCDKVDQGCNGGLMSNGFKYIIQNGGIDTESSYPYEAVDDTCKFNKANIGAKISNWTMIPTDEDQMAAWLVKQGPLSVAVDAEMWQFYIGGIFDFYFCGSTLDHGVLLVGYGHQINILDRDTPYWLIKNSWGADWGEAGYIKLEKGENLCAVNQFPCTSFA